MKNFRFVACVSAFIAAINLVACGEPLEADETFNSDSDKQPAADPPKAVCDAAKQDCDSDWRIGSADCGPNDATVYAAAPEVCDGKDNDCDGMIDEGCSPPSQPLTPANTDTDKDGYPDGPQDCAPQNPAIHPGATEVCADGVDNDCDGVTDEGCPVAIQPPPAAQPPVSEGTLSCTFTWPTSRQRAVNVQAFDHKSDLGGWWDKSENGSGQSLTVSLAGVPQDICGFRLNTAEGNPPNDWFCEGNGSTANLDPSTAVACSFAGKSATKADFRIWSASGGSASGCSAVWVATNHADCW